MTSKKIFESCVVCWLYKARSKFLAVKCCDGCIAAAALSSDFSFNALASDLFCGNYPTATATTQASNCCVFSGES